MSEDNIVQRIENIKGVAGDLRLELVSELGNALEEVFKIISTESALQGRIKQLEGELGVFKRAYTDTNLDKIHLEQQCGELRLSCDRQRESFEKQLQASRVVVLLDGDGAIFKPQLVSSGQLGGQKAASLLLENIKTHILSLGDIRQFHLAVYIFFNKKGLTETLTRCGYHSARVRFDEFVTGFNQATERFMMIDVGSDKEAADSKMRAFLDDEIRLPQTYKVVFGGCHDNGYVTTIRSHITSGFKHKLILLKSYSEHAAGFHNLELPVLSIPDLFITSKLTASPTQAFNSLPKPSPPPPDSPPRDILTPASGRNNVSQSSPKMMPKAPETLPFTYSKILFKHVERRPTIDTDSSSENNDDDDGSSVYRNASGTRRLNPDLPLSKQKPPPCTLFYLANSCKHGIDCKYAHNYILDADNYEEMKKNAKKSPCPAANRDEICTWADSCCYGHTCPQASRCVFLKKGLCKFLGADMHKEIKDSKN